MLSTAIAKTVVCVSGGWLEQFEGWLEAEGRGERTIRAYVQDVRSFAIWFLSENQQDLQPGLVTGVDLRSWRRFSLVVERVAPATWNRRRAAMRVFVDWATMEEFLSHDPWQGVEAAEEVELAPRWLGKGDLMRLLRQLEVGVNGARSEAWRAQAIRDQAMAALMVYAGLREGEVCKLDVGDVQLGERKGKVVVRLGKGEVKREAPLNGEARRAVRLWLEMRGEMPGALFNGKGCERVSERLVQRRVAELGRQAGVEVSPHRLRHTFAKRLLDEGAPLTVVSKLLGHARLETTARYVQPGWGDFEQAVDRI